MMEVHMMITTIETTRLSRGRGMIPLRENGPGMLPTCPRKDKMCK